MTYETHKPEKIQHLLSDYLAKKISADELIGRYMELWRQVRDEQWDAIDAIPGLKQALNTLNEKLIAKSISPDEYIAEYQKLVKQVTACEAPILTEIDESLSHLFGACDAYEPDPEAREIYQIGEPELREEVRKTLEILIANH